MHINTIFKLTLYTIHPPHWKRSSRLEGKVAAYFHTKEEAEEAMSYI